MKAGLSFTILICTLVLSGCGGDDDNSSAVVVDVPNPIVVNTQPEANAGADQTVNTESVVTLSGVGSDKEGDISVLWTQTGGPDIVLSDTAISNPTFVTGLYSETQILTFNFTVTDTEGLTNEDTVDVIVNVPLSSITSATGKWRIAKKEFDYDNNGVFEGVEDYTYRDGLLYRIKYTYTADNVDDMPYIPSFISSSHTEERTQTVEYDQLERPINYQTTTPNIQLEFDYAYTDESLILNEFTYSLNSPLFSQTANVNFIYNGNYISKIHSDANSSFNINNTYGYDTEQRVTVVDSEQYEYKFQWSIDNYLTQWRYIDKLTPNISSEANFIYIDGWLITATYVEINGTNADGTVISTSYDASYIYDSKQLPVLVNYEYNSSGQIDIVEKITWVEESCLLSGLWAPSPSGGINYRKYTTPEGTGQGTGWGWGGCL
ncbi:PKD domain-containing protein [Shewanella sp. 125m-1]